MSNDSAGSMMEGHPDTHAGLLNYDLLLLVMSKSRNHEVSRMMRTCSTLYRAGAKYILRTPVVLDRDAQIFSFCLFMLVKQPSRFRYLRELALMTDIISDFVVKMLVTVLRKATHLETLRLNWGDFVVSVDGLADAIASISSLRSITFDDATTGSLQVLRTMRAQLHNLTIFYGETEQYYPFFEQFDEPDRSQWHPLALGAPFASTLEEMELEYWNSYGRLEPPPDMPIFPNVHKLTICNETPWMRPYIRCLPNLTHLSVRIHIEGMNRFTPNWGLRRRETNRTSQLVHGSWEHLQEFIGSVMALYILALTNPIPRIIFTRMEAVHYVFLPDVLEDARPVYLMLSVWDDVCGTPNSELPTVLAAPGCSALKELSLWLEIGARNRERDFPALMDRLVDSLRHLPLEKFDLDMCPTHSLDPTPRAEPRILDVPGDPDAFTISWHEHDPPAPLVAAERFLDEFDPLVFANRVLEAVQTLKDIEVKVTGPRKRERRLAQLQRAEGKEIKVVQNLP